MNKSSSLTACLLLALPMLAPQAFAAEPTTDQFIGQAAMSDMFEIQSSQLAADRGNASTKTFAARMITDHQKTTDELQKMIASNAVAGTIPTAMSGAQQSTLDKLKTLNGADFDKQYKADQTSAHHEAISLFTSYANTGDHAGMKEWAIKTLPDLEEHLTMAEDLGS